MLNSEFIDDISRKIGNIVRETPVADVEKNLRCLLQSAFAKLDLVTREEFDSQSQVLLRTREQLNRLEQNLSELEARLANRE